MSKLSEEEYAKAYQKAYDEYQLAGSAYNIAISQQEIIITEIMERCSAHRDSLLDTPSKPGEYSPRTTAFDATEEERATIRNLEIESVIYKRLLNEKQNALQYLEKNKKQAPVNAFKESILDKPAKYPSQAPIDIVLKVLGLIAFIIIIKNAF